MRDETKVDEIEVRKNRTKGKKETERRKSSGRRSHVFLRSRSTWFVRASMWANNAHFGSNRDALHFVHYSVHVSMWLGCRGYSPLPTTSQPETTQASTVHEEGSPAHRPLLKDPEVHSLKFATRQVASSRMALPASSSGDEVEGSPSSRQGGLGDQIFGYRQRLVSSSSIVVLSLAAFLSTFHAWFGLRVCGVVVLTIIGGSPVQMTLLFGVFSHVQYAV